VACWNIDSLRDSELEAGIELRLSMQFNPLAKLSVRDTDGYDETGFL
jgi:hypothetical protein